VRREKVCVGFWEPESARILDEDSGEAGAFELRENMSGMVGKQILDHAEKKGDGIPVDAFVEGLLAD